ATLLDRAPPLQAVRREVGRRAAEVAERARTRAGSDVDVAADALARVEHVLQGDHAARQSGGGREKDQECGGKTKFREVGRVFRRGWLPGQGAGALGATYRSVAAGRTCGGRHGKSYGERE